MLRAFLYIFLTVYLSLISHAQEKIKHQRPEIGDISEVPYRSNSEKVGVHEKPQYFINHLGCKKSDGEKEIWDTDKYIWEIGKNIQNKTYTLANFITGIDFIFEKAYKFKNDFNEIFSWNKDKKPINSEDLNVYKKEREEFKSILKELLQPFEEESKKNHISPVAPSAYRKSYSLYKERIEKLNKWKEKYPQKIKILCPETPDNPENAFINYEKDALGENFKDKQHPPLDVLANHVVNSMGCEERERKTTSLPLWYVGDRIQSGEFSLEEWKEAFKKELDQSVKKRDLNKENRVEYENRFNELLSRFEKAEITDALPLAKGTTFNKDTALITDYRNIRNEDIRLQQWVLSKRLTNKDKFPCNPQKTIEGRGLIDQVHYALDPPQKEMTKDLIKNSCQAVGKNLEKKYEDQLSTIKEQIETVFYGAEPNFSPEDNPNIIRKEKGEINEIISKATNALKGKELSKSYNLAQNFTKKHSSRLAPIIEPRLSGIVLQGHIDELVSFWTKNFILNDTSPTSTEGQKLISNYLNTNNKASNSKMLLSCFESNGKIYFHTSHGSETQNTTYLSPGKDDSKNVLEKIEERRQKQSKNSGAHHFDQQTNWGTAQISFDQSSLSSPAGRYYHQSISSLIYSTSKNKKATESSEQVLSKIINECRLPSLLSKSSEDEINKVANELLKRMKRSDLGHKFSSLSWAHASQNSKNTALEDFAYIQQFCLPIHLNFAYQVYKNNPKYFGSLNSEKGRRKECNSVGDIDQSTNTVLNDVNNYVLGVLKTNHKNTSASEQFANITPEEIKKLKQSYASLELKEKEAEKNQELFENLKDDAVMTNYLKRTQESSMKEAWKLLSLSTPLIGWKNNENVETGPNLNKVLEEYASSDGSNYTIRKAELLNAQQERRNRSLDQLNRWIHERKNTFKGNFAKQLDESFYHLKDRFEALNDLYDSYEKELADQIRLCMQNSGDRASIASMLPLYNDPAPVIENKTPAKKPTKTQSKNR